MRPHEPVNIPHTVSRTMLVFVVVGDEFVLDAMLFDVVVEDNFDEDDDALADLV